jgi:N-acetyl-anhydromuramyl-L-alanine amidase AmpD
MYEDLKEKWRGFRYFDKYDEKQLQSVFELVKYLCEAFNIPKNIVPHTHFDMNLANSFKGILAHSNVREEKSDTHKLFPWNDLSKFINNT